jgi:hypothetical protein
MARRERPVISTRAVVPVRQPSLERPAPRRGGRAASAESLCGLSSVRYSVTLNHRIGALGRCRIMTGRTTVVVNEPIRIVHVAETVRPDDEL